MVENKKMLDLVKRIESAKKELSIATGVVPNKIVMGNGVLKEGDSRDKLEKLLGVKIVDKIF